LSWSTSIRPCSGFYSFYFQFNLCAKRALFSEPVTYTYVLYPLEAMFTH